MDNGTSFDFVEHDHAPQWVKLVVLTYLIVIFTVGVPCNCLLVYVIRKQARKTTTDYLVLTKASFELLCAAFGTNLNILRNTASTWKYLASDIYCKVYWFYAYFSGLGMTTLLVTIAVDRYMKICKPFYTDFTPKRSKILCLLITIFSATASVPVIMVYKLGNRRSCTVITNLRTEWGVYIRILGAVTLSYIVVISFAYLRIAVTLRKRHKNNIKAHMNICNDSSEKAYHLSFWNLFRYRITGNIRSPPHLSVSQEARVSSVNINRPNMFSMMTRKISPFSKTSTQATQSVNTLNQDGGRQTDVEENTAGPSRVIPSDKSTLSFKSYEKGHQKNTSAFEKLMNEERMLNRATRITFFITFNYIMSYFLGWLVGMGGHYKFKIEAKYFGLTLHMINCLINPFLLFFTSSKYRATVGKILRRG